MRDVKFHCIIVGKTFSHYPGLAKVLRNQDVHIQFKQLSVNNAILKQTLQRLQGATLVFVPEEILEQTNLKYASATPKDVLYAFTDLIWQSASDAIVVVLDKESDNDAYAYYVNDVQMSRLHFQEGSKASQLQLQFLVQTALLKYDFRGCKRLLGIAEKRCQWLVDSSVVAVAYISRELHLYANTPYLTLLGIDSVKRLRSLSVKDFVVKDDQQVFDGFIRSQITNPQEAQSLFIRMKNKDGATFRTNIRVIPSVYKSRRCLQLWVTQLDKNTKAATDIEKIWDNNEAQEKNKQKTYTKSAYINNVSSKKKPKEPNRLIKPELLLKEILNRKEAQLITQPLLEINKPQNFDNIKNRYLMVSLKVPYVQRHAVDDLLSQITQTEIKTLKSLFWDKVKLTRLFEILETKKLNDIRLLVRISEETINDKNQTIWILKHLRRLSSKSIMIVFMLPTCFDDSSQKATVEFIHKIKPYGCQYALDDFFVSSQTSNLLKHCKPQALRLYLPWLKKIEGNQNREFSLGRLIRKLESLNIRVIVPCGFSQEMKKLFILSGASFCQERISKSD